MKYLTALVFTSGMATLGVELTAARLLDPWFGNSQIVWSALIGLILGYLALGGWLGGRWADHHPHLDGLLLAVTGAAVGIALIPTVSTPVLRWAALGFNEFAPGPLAGALVAILALFSLPVILLGVVSPWAVRLALTNMAETGRITGRLYAASTVGSILGAFVPTLWLIPAVGSRNTLYLFAAFLLVVTGIGALRMGRHRILAPLALILIAIIWAMTPSTSIRAAGDEEGSGLILYEDESLYNYIAVREWGSERHLKLNEGVGIHSVYHPQSVLSLGIWDYFLLAPLLRPAPVHPEQDRVLLIGLAAGTVSQLWGQIYGPAPITGVELDPQILEIGRRYFAMDQPNLTAIAADGRRWLLSQPADTQWDVVAIDAYRPPYIPFHLTTVEFFQLARDHLSANGVVAINVGRSDQNYALVDALCATLGRVFPAVYILDEPGPAGTLGNSLVVAAMQPAPPERLAQNVAALPAQVPAEFRHFAQEAAQGIRPAQPPLDTIIFTDDRAPVEQVVHGIIWSFLFHD